MSLSKEHQEYHLTPKGWVEGSFFGDVIGGRKILPIPSERLLTVSCYDALPSAFANPYFYDHVDWMSEDCKALKIAMALYGNRPDWFGYKLQGADVAQTGPSSKH